jgi:murein DD-endopeptidase MepM/ murein hydrolase activator NlpD
VTRWTLALLFSIALPAAAQEPADPSGDQPAAAPRQDTLAIGRAFTRLFVDGKVDALWASMTPAGRASVGGSKEALRAFRAKTLGDFGDEVRLLSEARQSQGPQTVYTRTSLTTRYARGMELRFVYDDDALISAVTVRVATKAAPTVYEGRKAHTKLRLPFEGAWSVLWGGSEWADNRHASVSDQRFAYDFLAVQKGTSFSGNGRANEQYYCFGRKVLSPSDGTVVSVTNDVADNAPGFVSTLTLYGNNLVIDHGNGEFSLLAHLKKGSIVVKRGSRVRAGETVGLTGNSGTSTEPHLHYQLMDRADYLRAHGMPSQFYDYLADGQPMVRGEPTRNSIVTPRDRVKLTQAYDAER